MSTKKVSIDELEVGLPSIDLPPISTEDIELEEPIVDTSLLTSEIKIEDINNPDENYVIATTPIKTSVKKKKPTVIETKTNVKESRYFWPDGTKKHYCVKCLGGPYRRDEEGVHHFGDHMIVCDTCYALYYKIPEGKVVKGYRDHNYHSYEITPYKLPIRHGT